MRFLKTRQFGVILELQKLIQKERFSCSAAEVSQYVLLHSKLNIDAKKTLFLSTNTIQQS